MPRPTLSIGPTSKKQVQMLQSDATITLMAGSAGSGKSMSAALLILRFSTDPASRIIFFRRKFTEIVSPGGAWDEFVRLFRTVYGKNLHVSERDKQVTFPSGAVCKFSHLQHAKNLEDHKGAAYTVVIFDETSSFTEDMVIYLLSRLRSASATYTPRLYCMTNPTWNSFLRVWLEAGGYLDASGIPLEAESGTKRYFARAGNTMLWYRTKEEAEAAHGSGPESGIGSFMSISATCRDNPLLLKADPTYISKLMALPRVEMERLLLGSWYARMEASNIFKREWLVELNERASNRVSRVRAYDFAFTRPSEVSKDPDWTRGVLMSKDKEKKTYCIEDLVSIRDRPHVVEELIFKTAEHDGQSVVISIPKDPNGSAGAYAKDLQRRLAEKGYTAKLCAPVKSKLVRFAPFASVCQAGFVSVVKGDFNKELYEELEQFSDNCKGHDDIADAISDAFLVLNSTVTIPSLSLPNMQRQSFAGSTSNQFTIPTFAASSFGNN